MEKLFNESDVFQKERPTKLTDKQEKQFFLDMAKEAIENDWCNDDINIIAKDLSRLLFRIDNGFQMAKELENNYNSTNYNIDSEFCSWLDELDCEYRDIVNKNVKEWVIAHNIKPKYTKGSKFIMIKDSARNFRVDEIIYINSIYADMAKYIIHRDKNYCGGTYISFEKMDEYCKLSEH